MLRIAIASLFSLFVVLGRAEIAEKDWERIDLDNDHTAIEASDKSRRASAIPQDTVGDVVVPSVLRTRQVVSIGEKAFYGCINITSVVIPEGVTNIGYRAFYNCSSLTNVVLPTTLKSIGSEAFVGCYKLGQVVLNVATLNIGSSSFKDLNSLTNVTIVSSGKITCGTSVFNGCSNLKNVKISSPYESVLGASMFEACRSLTGVELPMGLMSVSTNMFYACKSLGSVMLSTNVTRIAYRGFDSCSSLRSVKLPQGLVEIESQAFFGCSKLQNLAVPMTVSVIGDRSFESCDSLSSVMFDDGGTNKLQALSVSVGERAFYDCAGLTNVILSGHVSSFGARAFAECGLLSNVQLPTNLTTIAESMFESCGALTMIRFPETMSFIGDSAFQNCISLTGFTIPTNNVVSVGRKAFSNTRYWNDWPDDSLVVNNGYILGFKGNPTKVELPEQCKTITYGMFEGMTNLTEVILPTGLVSVDAHAFAGSGLRSIDFSRTRVASLGASAFEGCQFLKSCLLPTTITAIPDNAFKNCIGLLSVSIPDSVISVGVSAFQACSNLVSVTGGSRVGQVSDYAFAGCVTVSPFRFGDNVSYGNHVFQGVNWTENVLVPEDGTMAQEYPSSYDKIKSVMISASQTNLQNNVCSGCKALSSVIVPDGVISIGTLAFSGCASITSVVLAATVSNVGSNAFHGCKSLTSVTVPGTQVMKHLFPDMYQQIKAVNVSFGSEKIVDHMLDGCASVLSVDIPWTVTEIGAYAFADCSSIATGITIPENVTSIGGYAFQNCKSIDIVRYLCDCPQVGTNIYAGTKQDLVSGVLKVRSGWTESSGANSGSTASSRLPETWPSGKNARNIAWWITASLAKISFSYYDTTGRVESRYVLKNGGRYLGSLPEEPERQGYDFVGWFTDPRGGEEITAEDAETLVVNESLTLYARWRKEGDPDDDEEDGEDEIFDVSKAQVFDAYLMNGDEIAGTASFKLAKGKIDRKKDVTTSAVTASVELLGNGKKISLKGTAEVDGSECGCELSSSKKSDENVMDVVFTSDGMTGSYDGMDIVGARRVGSSDAKAFVGNKSIVLLSEGESPLANGYVVLSSSVAKSGKVKVSGMMPDGTKVAVSSQLIVREGSAQVPVVVPMYVGKTGGFGFLLQCEDDVWSVAGITDWNAESRRGGSFEAKLSCADDAGLGIGDVGAINEELTFVLGDNVDIDGVEIADDLLPMGMEVSFEKNKFIIAKADTVKFNKNDEMYEITKDNGNPSGLKLTYAKSTGMFSGSFTIYAIASGRQKKMSAKVSGAFVNGIGYGIASVKGVGCLPVLLVGD